MLTSVFLNSRTSIFFKSAVSFLSFLVLLKIYILTFISLNIVSVLAQDAITKYLRLGSLSNRNIFSFSF